MNRIIEKTVRNLERDRITADVANSGEEVIRTLDDLIPDGAVVGAGDSLTLEQLGVYDHLRRRDIKFLDKHKDGLGSEEKRQIYLASFHADFFISGVNAVSASGRLYFMDGNGSRLAPIIYGPEKVILISGINKISEDNVAAVKRIREIAAPRDALRLDKCTPCTISGHCEDCKSEEKICNYFSFIQGQFDRERIRVLLVKRHLGF